MFLQNHYTVLMPDSRGHGESAGLVTYGLLEAEDVHRWVDPLAGPGCPGGIFALGESLGADILLQALPDEPRLRAVVAESPFSSFARIARERIAQHSPLSPALAAPLVWAGLLYAQLKYGLDFHAASPENAVSCARTPILLIHGLADHNIHPEHSRIINARNPRNIQLWLVKDAGHTGALAAAPEEFKRRVLSWFAAPPEPLTTSLPLRR